MIGVLLTNLGTPDAPTPAALRCYLAEFLSDPRVIEIPKLLWWPILHGIILRTRPQRSAALYQKIWTPEGSPLLVYSQRLAEKLQQQLGSNIKVALGMRYGNPSINHALEELRNTQKVIILPLYPQYAASTTGSTFDAVVNVLKKWRHVPELHFIQPYHQEPAYIAAITETIRMHWDGQSHLLFSFHGLPQRAVKLGDPYQRQCQATAYAIAETLHLNPDQWRVVFQSRFGYAEWLQPYCDKTLQSLPQQGIKSVTVVCPGFAIDCLETLEEIMQQNRDIFIKAGGESFRYIPALNNSEAHIKMITMIIHKYM